MDSATAYEQHAHGFLRSRDQSLIGSGVVREWALGLPKGAEVIEIACGGGHPVTGVLAEAGLRIWAIDSSKTLIREFQSRFPEVPTQCASVQETDFFNRKFHAAISIGLIFLLPELEQEKLIGRVAEALETGGKFLFTAPIETGTWQDTRTDIECRSLGQARYQTILESSGLQILKTLEDKGKNNYYATGKIDSEDS